MILLGFSPNVDFIRHARSPKDSDEFSGAYPYVYDNGDFLFYFSDWNCSRHAISERIDFFATPEFLMEYGDGSTINITIRDPRKVTLKFMRERIEKLYKIFRDRLEPPRSGWGEKSGRRRLIEKRNKFIRDKYRQLRKEKPSLSAARTLEKVIAEMDPQYGCISFERAKRIIYSSEGNMS
jgi:hypothetical protein